MKYKPRNFHADIQVKRIAGIQYFEFLKNYHSTSPSHAFMELVYVDKGRIIVNAERYSGFLEQQQMLIHQTNEKHGLSCETGCAPNVIFIGFECDCPLLETLARTPIHLSVQNQKLLAEIVKESHSVFLPPYDIPYILDMKKREKILFGAEQLIYALLERLLIDLIRETELKDAAAESVTGDSPVITSSLLLQLCQYIDANLMQKLSLEQISLLFATNRTTICRLFRENLGCTFVDYLNKKRIEFAKTLIRGGGRNFSQISEELNISSVHYFTKLFTKYEHMTPGQYIKSLKSKQS